MVVVQQLFYNSSQRRSKVHGSTPLLNIVVVTTFAIAACSLFQGVGAQDVIDGGGGGGYVSDAGSQHGFRSIDSLPGWEEEKVRVVADQLPKKGQLEVAELPPVVMPLEGVADALPLTDKRMARGGKTAGILGNDASPGDTVFIAVTVVCSAGAIVGLVGAAALWYRLHRRYKSTEEAEYGPQYGVTGPKMGQPGASPVGDAKLANSAHLYHYQHTKQQIIAMENGEDGKGQESDDSEGEGEEADYSVYECPGLAPTGDIEVSNPLFESGSPVPSPPASSKPSSH